jgi:D-3-phosphoglycerate dehydrogenase
LKVKKNIFVADSFHPGGIDILNNKFNVITLAPGNNTALLNNILKHAGTSGALIVRSVRNIDLRFVKEIHSKTKIDLICTVSTGYDNIDLAACKKYGIKVMNVSGANSTAAAEFTMAVILSISKNLIAADHEMKKGSFNSALFTNFELAGKTIGVIGVGRIGSKVAKLSRSFGMNVIGNDINRSLKRKYPFINFLSLDKLIKNSDIITVHTPLDKSTFHLLNSANLRLCKKNVIVINCSRGGTIDERSLLNLLKSGKILYAGIDVFEKEPVFNREFTRLKNVILTPHLAGKTFESRERMAVAAAHKIIKFYSKKLVPDDLIN